MMRASWLSILLIGCANDHADTARDSDAQPSGYVPEVPDLARYADCEVTVAEDFYGDGVVDGTNHRTYDALGWLVRDEWDDGPDGTLDWVETWSARNAYGLHERYELDDVLDLGADRVEEHGVDEHLYLWTTIDEGSDGTIEERSTFTNADGVMRSLEIDEGDDGSVDVRGELAYDTRWRLLREDRDRLVDGTVDEWWETTWEGPEDDSREEVHQEEDGTVETTAYEYDGDRLMFYAFDSDDLTLEYTYTYEASSDRVEQIDLTVNDGLDSGYTAVITYTWDEADRITSSLFTMIGGANLAIGTTYDWSCP